MRYGIKLIPIVLLTGFLSMGCGTKTISTAPEITYGNPKHKHFKDLPQFRYDKIADAAKKEKKQAQNQSADEYEALGDAFLQQGNYFMAYTQYEKSLEKDPENMEAVYKQGLVLLREEKTGDAVTHFKTVLKNRPDSARAYEGLGRAYFASGNFQAARASFNTAIGFDPLLWRSYQYLGMIHHRNKELEAAVSAYKAALTIKPDAGFIHNNLGVSLSASGRSLEAVESFKQALLSGHTGKTVFNNLGWALCDLERYEEAFEAFQKAGGKAVAYNNTGVGYLRNGNCDKAAGFFKKAIEESPRFYVTAHENLQKCVKK